MDRRTLFASLLLIGNSYAADTTLNLAVYLPQSPPYMFIDLNTGAVTGILPDIIKNYAQKHDLKFAYQYLNRVRAEHSLYNGSADVSLLAPAWVQYPDKLIYSDPLYVNGDRFYSVKPMPAKITFNGQVVCTREFFRYPIFDKLVEQKKVIRMDTESEVSQLRMLLSGRCDYAYLNEWVADYMIRNDFSFAQFYRAETTFDSSNGILAFHPKWQERLPEFNEYIRQIKQSGELTRIVESYTK